MSPADQVRIFYERIWNERDLSAVPAVLHPDVAFRGSLGTECRGQHQFVAYLEDVTRSLSAYRCRIEHLVVEDASAAARLRFSGRHTGTFLGRLPSGRMVEWSGAAFFRFADGLAHDVWVLGDIHSLLAQLDARAEPGS